MMKKIFALVITLFVILLMALTCPDKKAHTEAIRSAVSGYVNETLSQRHDDNIVMGFLGSLFVSKVAEVYLDNSLEVSNYLLVILTINLNILVNTKIFSFKFHIFFHAVTILTLLSQLSV